MSTSPMRKAAALLTLVVPVIVIAFGVFAGCSSQTFSSVPDAATAATSWQPDASPTDSLVLTPWHPGWKKQLCLGCHGQTAPYPHADSSYVPPACVSCHGYNGAPHTDHATRQNVQCTECHGDVAHVAAFKAPDDCVVCHYHPAQP